MEFAGQPVLFGGAISAGICTSRCGSYLSRVLGHPRRLQHPSAHAARGGRVEASRDDDAAWAETQLRRAPERLELLGGPLDDEQLCNELLAEPHLRR